MGEKEASHEELEVFREEIREAIDSIIFLIVSGLEEGYIPVDPFSLGLGEKTLADISSQKQGVVKEELYKRLGLTEENRQTKSTYQTGENNDLTVNVFEGTEVDEEGEEKSFFVHEINHPEGELDWHLSANLDPIEVL